MHHGYLDSELAVRRDLGEAPTPGLSCNLDIQVNQTTSQMFHDGWRTLRTSLFSEYLIYPDQGSGEVYWALGALYATSSLRHNHQSQPRVNKLTSKVKRNQKHKFYNLQKHPIKASPGSICSIPISGPWPAWHTPASAQGLDFFFWELPSVTIWEFTATFCIETSTMIYLVSLSPYSSDCVIDINLFLVKSLKFHVLVLIMKFFNFIESFYGRHQHGLAWDMNILGKIWINLKFSNNIIGSLADFNIATAEASATKPTQHTQIQTSIISVLLSYVFPGFWKLWS